MKRSTLIKTVLLLLIATTGIVWAIGTNQWTTNTVITNENATATEATPLVVNEKQSANYILELEEDDEARVQVKTNGQIFGLGGMSITDTHNDSLTNTLTVSRASSTTDNILALQSGVVDKVVVDSDGNVEILSGNLSLTGDDSYIDLNQEGDAGDVGGHFKKLVLIDEVNEALGNPRVAGIYHTYGPSYYEGLIIKDKSGNNVFDLYWDGATWGYFATRSGLVVGKSILDADGYENYTLKADSPNGSATSSPDLYFGNERILTTPDGDHKVYLTLSGAVSADRTLTISLNDADTTLSLDGDIELDQDLTTTSEVTFGKLTVSGNSAIVYAPSGSDYIDFEGSTGYITSVKFSTGQLVLRSKEAGKFKFWIYSDGRLAWGDGSADTELYRSAADTLYTPDNLLVGSKLQCQGQGYVVYDPNASTNLKIQSGTVTIVNGTATESFDTAFSSPPTVVLTPLKSGVPEEDLLSVWLTHVDENGFECIAKSITADGTSYADLGPEIGVTVYWIAIGN